ncbi:amino acid adenylation domain-containing protein [Nocardioides sp. Bht2]|uniref:amino acid adenylation domain-containing protein n=1 Tax=Nocardioides sp. Bht2 TaxID=3392297 RepID=UPI0039B56401
MTSAPEDAGWLPLTAAQRGLWFAHSLRPENPSLTTAEVVEVEGEIDVAALQRSHLRAYAEFEQLRVEVGLGPDGPQQRVRTVLPQPPALVDLSAQQDPAAAARSWLAQRMAVPFGLEGELVGSAVLRLGADRHWWFHAAHHLVIDGTGAQHLLRRIAELYAAEVAGLAAAPSAAPSLAALVADEALQDDELLDGQRAQWRALLGGGDEATAPGGVAGEPAPAARRVQVDLDPELVRALVVRARELRMPWPDLATVAVGTYLARMGGGTGTRIGVPLMNRTRPGRAPGPAARTVCTAVNVLPVRVLARGRVAEVVGTVSAELAFARANSRLRFEELTRMVGENGERLYGAQVNVLPFADALPLGESAGRVRNLSAGPVDDLTVCLRGNAARGRVSLEIDAHPRLWDERAVAGHLARLPRWLATFLHADDEVEVATLELLTPAERAELDGFNDTSRALPYRSLPQAFADQVALTPEATALRFGEEERSYRELAQRAGELADALRAGGVEAGEPVGIALHRGFALYEALYAVQALGAVYLPIEPGLPPARVEGMVADAGARWVLSDAEIAPTLPPGLAVLDVDQVPTGDSAPVGAVRELAEEAPAYVLFTSGSTGRPKGVEVGHAAIDNRLAWMQHQIELTPGSRVLHKTPISFDVSIWELFWPLQVGASVVIAAPDDHRDPRALARTLVEQRIDVVHFVPSMLRALLADPVARRIATGARLQALVCSGEALAPDLAADAAAVFGVGVTNLYGPTEAAVDVTCWECPATADEVPIGGPIWNTRCYVLDAEQRPVPIGVPGELYLAGVQLATRYVGAPELTARAFVTDPVTGERMYRTGDLASWRADGVLRYLGRIDHQVKVRGQRIELAEVEATLLDHPEVVDAVAAAVGEPERLVAWIVPAAPLADPAAFSQALREELRKRLTSAMVPTQIGTVDVLPLTVSGKTDRKAVARWALPVGDGRGAAPQSLLAEQFAALMGEVLGGGPLAADADFFDHGGDSLRALQVVALAEDRWGAELGVADLFTAPTPAALAERISAGAAGGSDVGDLLALRGGDGVPLFALPPAGGLGWCYSGLLRSLPSDQPLWAVQTPGLADGAPEPVADLQALARRQLAAIRSVVGSGPFHLVGWSVGGMAAHEVATLARAEGQEVGVVALLDAYPADQWHALGEPDEQEALRGLLRMAGAEDRVADDVELSRAELVEILAGTGSALAALPEQVLAGCLASVIDSARLVRTSQQSVGSHRVLLFAATAPRPESWLEPTGWRRLAGELQVHEIATTHGELVRAPAIDEVGRVLAELLTASPVLAVR